MNSPEVANSLCLIHVSTPTSKSIMRTIAAAKCEETWRNPIMALRFRETLDGTNAIAAANNNKAPTKDT